MSGGGILAVLPVKRLGGALRRLSPALPGRVRRDLQVAMLQDVLGACRASSRLAGTVVVSSDPDAAALARELADAQVMFDHEPPRGINGAVRRGVEHARATRAEGVLILTADLPLIAPADIDELLVLRAPRRSVVLVPSRDGTGTNALLVRPAGALAPMLGPDSLSRHLEQARCRDLWVARHEVDRIGLDIDTPRDLEALITEGGPCATLEACRRLGVARLLRAGSAL